MKEETGISWAHFTHNFWLGCDKIASECAHCYIGRDLRKQGRQPWGRLYLTQTYNNPFDFESLAKQNKQYVRVFTCSESDFFHAQADKWRAGAWRVIKNCPHAVWLILTKRPERILRNLPADWPYANVWLGVSTGCKKTLNKMDVLRDVPIHPEAVRFVSAEPLLEDISQEIDLTGFGWLVVGGESGGGVEYLWNPAGDWRAEFSTHGRRTMHLEWAETLRDKVKGAGLSFLFKQITNARPSQSGMSTLIRPPCRTSGRGGHSRRFQRATC